jgi:hypothetical protein
MVSVNTLANSHQYQVHSYVRKLPPILLFPVQITVLVPGVKIRFLFWRLPRSGPAVYAQR